MVLENLGNCADQMFHKENSQHVSEFNDQQLVTMPCKEKLSLDKWFSLYTVFILYTNQDIVDSLSQSEASNSGLH